MNILRKLSPLAVLIVLLTTAVPLAAQAREKIPDHKFERQLVVDADGLQQWGPWDIPCPTCKRVKSVECSLCLNRTMAHCIQCKGEKRSVCPTCVGTARVLDPMVELSCPYCRGSGVYPCAQCWGSGVIEVVEADGSLRPTKCRGCKERGGFDCTPCDGKGILPAIPIKKKPLAEAKLKDMLETREVLKETLAQLEKFELEESHRKSEKAFEKLLKSPSKTYPVLKDVVSLLEEVHKGFAKSGAGYDNYDGKLNHQFYIFQDRTIWLLRYQLLVLDLEIARTEFNEAVLAEKK